MASKESTSYMDLLITTLQEHEKVLDELIEKLGMISANLEAMAGKIRGSPAKPKDTPSKEHTLKTVTRRWLDVCTGILLTSGLMDLWLWFREGAMIPSWTMTVCAGGIAALIQVVRKVW